MTRTSAEERRVRGEPFQGRPVQVVVVGVRDGNEVKREEVAGDRDDLHGPPQPLEGFPEDGIREDPDALQLDEGGGVPPVRDPDLLAGGGHDARGARPWPPVRSPASHASGARAPISACTPRGRGRRCPGPGRGQRRRRSRAGGSRG